MSYLRKIIRHGNVIEDCKYTNGRFGLGKKNSQPTGETPPEQIRWQSKNDIRKVWRLLDNNFGAFKSPVYLGFSLERGNIWAAKSEMNWNDMQNAASIYVGSDTFLGPVYLAYGQADSGDSSAYLLFGDTFGM